MDAPGRRLLLAALREAGSEIAIFVVLALLVVGGLIGFVAT